MEDGDNMLFKHDIKVRYQETDQMGVAHHSVYPVWYEEARTSFMSATSMPYSEMEKQGFMLPVSKLECKYIKPAYFEDILTIHTQIKSVTAVKIDVYYQIYRENILIHTGYTEHPFVDKDFKMVNLKKSNFELYRQFLNNQYK